MNLADTVMIKRISDYVSKDDLGRQVLDNRKWRMACSWEIAQNDLITEGIWVNDGLVWKARKINGDVHIPLNTEMKRRIVWIWKGC